MAAAAQPLIRAAWARGVGCWWWWFGDLAGLEEDGRGRRCRPVVEARRNLDDLNCQERESVGVVGRLGGQLRCGQDAVLRCDALHGTALHCAAFGHRCSPGGTEVEEGEGGSLDAAGSPGCEDGTPRQRRMGGSEGRNRLAGDGTMQRRKRGLVRQDKRRSKRPRVVWKNENWSRLIDGGEGGHGREPSGGVHAATTEVLVFSG